MMTRTEARLKPPKETRIPGERSFPLKMLSLRSSELTVRSAFAPYGLTLPIPQMFLLYVQ